MINQLYTLKALSQLHCGIGQGLNDIDLPTARHKLTGHPLVPASSLKGVLKAEYKPENSDLKETWKALFGGNSSSEHASAISIGDANLLAITMRSYFGTYAYLASPYTLLQLKNLLERSGSLRNKLPKIPEIGNRKNTESYKIQVCKGSLLPKTDHNVVLLEELDLLVDSASADAWADIIAPLYFTDEEGQAIFKKRFAITDDNALNFLCETSLPVDARISIDEKTGTVKKGALWYEESVPMDSLFLGSVSVDRSFRHQSDKTDKELYEFLLKKEQIICQVGGKSTTGKGVVEIKLQPIGEKA